MEHPYGTSVWNIRMEHPYGKSTITLRHECVPELTYHSVD